MVKKIKEEKSVVVRNVGRRLAWGGVIPNVKVKEEDAIVLREFCNKVAQIYGVPSVGVNAMGGNPYLNKDGRLFLLAKYRTGKIGVKFMRTEFLQFSKSPTETAIAKTIITFKDGVEIEGIGEASQSNCKLDAVKQTLNMMAETRATNRAIWKAIAYDVWNGIAENLAKMTLTEDEKNKIINAGKVSSEEMQQPEAKVIPLTGTPDEEIINQLIGKVNETDDIPTLMDYAQKLAKGKSSKKVKETVAKYIQDKVGKLS